MFEPPSPLAPLPRPPTRPGSCRGMPRSPEVPSPCRPCAECSAVLLLALATVHKKAERTKKDCRRRPGAGGGGPGASSSKQHNIRLDVQQDAQPVAVQRRPQSVSAAASSAVEQGPGHQTESQHSRATGPATALYALRSLERWRSALELLPPLPPLVRNPQKPP